MSKQALHRIAVSIIVFIILVFALLFLLSGVLGVLWLLLCGLILSVLTMKKNPVCVAEIEYWQKKKQKLVNAVQARRQAKKEEGLYSNEFVPDHMLISLDAANPKKYRINKETWLIGSKGSCDCILGGQRPSTVSAQHCKITYRKHSRTYYVEDLRSTNGTYLGTKRLEPFTQEKLLDDMELTIGHMKFRFVKKN